MKKFYVTLLISVVANWSIAQQRFILSHIDNRGFVNLSGGISTPIKSLFKADPTAPSDVTALRGSAFQVAVGYRLGHRLGAMASFTSCINEAGTNQLLQNIQKSHLGASWSVSGGSWNCSHFTAGPYISFTKGLWMIDMRALGGYSWVQRPSTELKGNYTNVPIYIKTSQTRSGSFTAGVGTSVRLKIGRNFAAAIHADYIATRSIFNNLTSTLRIGNDEVQENIREVHSIGLLSLNGGISFLF